MSTLLLVAVLLFGLSVMQKTSTRAAPISQMRDLISESGASLPANHTISFTLLNAVPPSGSIVITPEDADFTIPAAMDHEDVDLSVNGTDRDLAAFPGAGGGSPVGVAITAGASGSLVLTLNDTDDIAAGSSVVIEIGTHASHQVAGVEQIVNPAVPGISYTIDVVTRDALASVIDAGQTRIMILEKVITGVGGIVTAPPERSNGLPDMDLPNGTTTVVMSLETNIIALCRYATTPDVIYDNMPFNFGTSFTTDHQTTLTGLTDATSYIFYVRCINFLGEENTDDFVIEFSVLPTGSGTGGTSGGGGTSSGGASGSGSGGPGSSSSSGQKFPPPPENPALSMNGWAPREALLRILKAGQLLAEGKASITGDFSLAILEMQAGVHTISVSATDADNRSTRALSFTFSIEPDTTTVISGVQLPPTIGLSTNQVDRGGLLTVSGMAPPSKPVEIWISEVGKRDAAIRQEVTAGSDGRYNATIPVDLPTGAYDVRARAFNPQVGWGEFSERVPLGVGQSAPLDTCQRSDINRDTRVNLIDFSILLFHWTTNFPDADINSDGTVNLIDFSIQLFCWTG
ncbi:MAG: hypothetical protein Q8P61_03335 [Candidatus Nanopelagicales bacterium]|nr:hypothetical protein [Candidatus Nanopelagicales bacterium]